MPENYRIFEHHTASVASGGTVNGPKIDRTDAYLYGHPGGRKKRYRSPADFYPHLLWLATDASGDNDNCGCKICCPLDVEDVTPAIPVIPQQKKSFKQEVKLDTKQEPKSKPAPTKTSKDVTTSNARQGSQSTIPSKSTASSRRNSVGDGQPIAETIQRNEIHSLDITYNNYIYRLGEMVWFSRGTAWGIGIIVKRWKSNTAEQQNASNYTIQPLSNPLSHPEQVTVSSDHHLRPWLAWSIPGFTHAYLNGVKIDYNAVDWNGLKQGKYGSGDLEVDGSILAAKAIDLSFSPFQPIIRDPSKSYNPAETYYEGAYIGAERLWRDDLVRLRSSPSELLHIRFIFLRTSDKALQSRLLYFRGDIYTLKTYSATDKSAPSISTLPSRLSEDLRRRNAFTASTKQTITSASITRRTTTISSKDVRGRWYEATLLALVLSGAGPAEADMSRGNIVEMGCRMNGRFECQVGVGAETSLVIESAKRDRKEALGRAVPDDLVIEGEDVSATN